eukprot:6347139-Prymnesium_polylepis.1
MAPAPLLVLLAHVRVAAVCEQELGDLVCVARPRGLEQSLLGGRDRRRECVAPVGARDVRRGLALCVRRVEQRGGQLVSSEQAGERVDEAGERVEEASER